MPIYRFYRLDQLGRIAAPSLDRVLPDDEAACEHAHVLLREGGAHASAQVWQGERLVRCVEGKLQAS